MGHLPTLPFLCYHRLFCPFVLFSVFSFVYFILFTYLFITYYYYVSYIYYYHVFILLFPFTRRLNYMGKSTLSWGGPVLRLVGYPFLFL